MTSVEFDEVPPDARSRLRKRVVGVILALLTAAGTGAWYFLRADPQQLLQQANACTASDPAKAERLLTQSISAAAGRFPEAEMALCRLRASRGDWEGARSLYTALDRAACSDEFLVEFGRAALRARAWDKAADALEEVRRRGSPARATALPLLAGLYFERQEGRKMLECLREQARLEPDRPEMWWNLLRLLQERHLDGEYLITLNEALQQNLPEPDKHELQFKLVVHLVEKGDGVAASGALDRLIEREGLTPRVKFHQAAVCRMEGEPQRALKILEDAAAHLGDVPAVIRLRALINFDLGRFADAVHDFRLLLKEEPFDLTGHFKLAEAYRALGQLDLSRRHAETAVEIRKKRHRINTLKELSKRRPADVASCEELAQLHAELNESEESRLWEERARQARARRDGP